MKKYRINTDIIDIAWTIFRNANIPENFGGDDIVDGSIELVAVGNRSKVRLPFAYENGNRVKIYFMADKQYAVGVYDLILTYKVKDSSVPGGMRTYVIDYCDAFQLVARSCDIETPPPSEYVGIVENLRGYSAYEVWKMAGNDGTVDDYMNWLREPATTVAESVVLAEAIRGENESNRIDNEQSRIESEHLRTLQEEERGIRDAERILAEDARASAEENRVDLYVRMQQLEADTVDAKNYANGAAQLAETKATAAASAAERAEMAASNWIKKW